jgi:predicted phage terminase large subunit-like protein
MDKKDLYKQILRKDLSAFVKKCFNTLNTGQEYIHNWHIDLICEYLTAVEKGEIKRLNINIQPRFMKSDICSVAFPAWYLGKNPEKKIINCSYSASLSQQLHNKSRRIVATDWYRYCFPEFNINNAKTHTKDTQSEFQTTKNGFRVATSTGGSITGKGADILMIDDGMNPQEAFSETKRQSALDWFSQTFFSRLNNAKTGTIVNIQQRLHEDDFTGYFCDTGWENLIIPTQFDRPKIYSFGNFKKEVKTGEYLHEERFGKEEIESTLKDIGSYAFAGQYMQEPAPLGGGIFKDNWWKYYKVLPIFEYRQIFVDTAQKIKEENDYTVFQCWGKIKDGKGYLIDQIRGKWEAPELERQAVAFWNKHKNRDTGSLRNMVVEDKSSGTGLIQTIKRKHRIPIGEIKPDKDKLTRAMGVVGYIESGYIYLPSDAPWLSDYLHEFSLFPNGSHDDQVDPTVYAIDSMFVRKPVRPRVRGLL